MKSTLPILLLGGAVSAASGLLLPYAECGGVGWYNEWRCQAGYTCRPVKDALFPPYQCLPNAVPVNFPGRENYICGGPGWTGNTNCYPGLTCVAMQFFHVCTPDPNYKIPPSTTPDLVPPGGFCGSSGWERFLPTSCVPGHTCTEASSTGYFVCIPDPLPVTTTKTTTTKVMITTLKTTTKTTTTTTSSSKTTAKVSTTTSKNPVTTKQA